MPNHISNGVFETNTATGSSQNPSGWTATEGSPDLQTDGNFEWSGSWMPSDLDAADGGGYITLYSNASYNEGLSTTLGTQVQAGQTYTFNFDYYVNDSDGTTNQPGATDLIVTIGTQTITVPIDSTGATAPYWESTSVTFTATETTSDFAIGTSNDAGSLNLTGIALDNLDLDVAPDYIVEGTSGNDVIDVAYVGDPEGDMIDAGDHSDGSDADSVLAGAGDDSVVSGAGNDTVFGADGSDTILGGAGDDFLDGDDAFATGGADSIDGGAGNDQIIGDVGNDTLIGGTGNDTVYAGADDDLIEGGGGDDQLFGEAGDDTIVGGAGADTLIGGAGDDALVTGSGDSAQGGDGDDLFTIDDTLSDGTGITIVGGEGGETLGDTLDFQGLVHWDDVTYTNTDPGVGGGLSGTATLDDGTIVNFDEIENVIICFTAGTRIATPRGAREVEALAPGDLVITRDNGLQPIRWVGRRTVPALGALAPVKFAPGILGNERELLVSPQHRMLLQGPEASLLFGESEILATAKHLVNGGTVTQTPGGEITYVHILFDQHEIVYAEGAPSESFFPGGEGLGAVEDAAREELFALFPELRSDAGAFGETARFCLKAYESELLRLG